MQTKQVLPHFQEGESRLKHLGKRVTHTGKIGLFNSAQS